MARPIVSSAAAYILTGATWSTSVTPAAKYDVATCAYLRPDWRIRWAAKTVTVTATLGSSARADVVAIPMSNLDPGSAVLALTNGAGLNVPIPIPTLPADRLPLTAVCDLRDLASEGTRTSTTWHFVITANSVDVTLGSCLWLGTAVDLSPGVRPGIQLGEIRFNGLDPNAYGTVNRVRMRTRQRWCAFGVPSTTTDRDALVEWARAGEGSGRPSLFWLDPSVNDAFIGSWPDEYSSSLIVRNFSPMDGLRFTEWSKGLPLLGT